MEKYAQDDRLNQLKQQEMRLKQQEHLKQVEEMITERRLKKQESIMNERMEYEKFVRLKEFEDGVVEQERQKLLSEHASKLNGFLPKVLLLIGGMEK